MGTEYRFDSGTPVLDSDHWPDSRAVAMSLVARLGLGVSSSDDDAEDVEMLDIRFMGVSSFRRISADSASSFCLYCR